MTNSENSGGQADPRARSWWTALGGLVLFVLVGMILMPGIARQERAPRPDPGAAAPGATRDPEIAPRAERDAREVVLAPALPDDSFDCMILPSEVVDIGSAVTGRIGAIRAERGQYVEAGQVVVELEANIERAAVNVARARAGRSADLEVGAANLALSQKRRQRAEKLLERESVSLDLHDEVETRATLAGLELERARENHRIAILELEAALAALELRTIRSPVSGFVVERLMAPGEVVDEQTILRIAQVDPLRVEVILPSRAFGRVGPGDRAEVIPEAPLDRAHSAEVVLVDPMIDAASGTLGARLLLPNPQRSLPAGLRCRVRFRDHTALVAGPLP